MCGGLQGKLSNPAGDHEYRNPLIPHATSWLARYLELGHANWHDLAIGRGVIYHRACVCVYVDVDTDVDAEPPIEGEQDRRKKDKE